MRLGAPGVVTADTHLHEAAADNGMEHSRELIWMQGLLELGGRIR